MAQALFNDDGLTITCGDGMGGLQDVTMADASVVFDDTIHENVGFALLTVMSYLQSIWGYVCAPNIMPVNTAGDATGNASIGMV